MGLANNPSKYTPASLADIPFDYRLYSPHIVYNCPAIVPWLIAGLIATLRTGSTQVVYTGSTIPFGETRRKSVIFAFKAFDDFHPAINSFLR
jgi:hypothetical protein